MEKMSEKEFYKKLLKLVTENTRFLGDITKGFEIVLEGLNKLKTNFTLLQQVLLLRMRDKE